MYLCAKQVLACGIDHILRYEPDPTDLNGRQTDTAGARCPVPRPVPDARPDPTHLNDRQTGTAGAHCDSYSIREDFQGGRHCSFFRLSFKPLGHTLGLLRTSHSWTLACFGNLVKWWELVSYHVFVGGQVGFVLCRRLTGLSTRAT